MSAPVTGRFAPTPSGRLHLGNLLCALLAYLSARSQGGRFLLRIEDVDVPRCPRALADQCIADLKWLGIAWDEPPLYQSERTAVYEEAFARLHDLGLVYPCFCTRAQLHAAAAPHLGEREGVYPGTCARLSPQEAAARSRTRHPAMRLRVPDEQVAFCDGLYGPYAENLSQETGDFIIRRSDGLFGYQFAVVVDDALSGVTEVVRGRDILPSTPRQLYLQRLLGYPALRYVHIPLLTDSEGRRLAKRDRDLDLTALSRRFSREEVLGLLAHACGLLDAWRPVTMEALIRDFSWARVSRQDARLSPALTRA